MEQNNSKRFFGVSTAEVIDLLRPAGNPEGVTKAIFIFVGLLLTPITLFGSLIFYKKGWKKFMEPQNEFPRLNNLSPIMRFGMIIGPFIAWAILYLTTQIMVRMILWIGGDVVRYNPNFVLLYLGANVIFTVVVLLWFSKWRGGIYKYLSEIRRFGTARFATLKELLPYRYRNGFYIGIGLFYRKAGHLLTVAGTRAGKGVNLILYNLLMPGLFKGSWVIIDPKAENAIISGRIQKLFGRKVFYLNPFNMFELMSTGYNPLDMLSNDINLADDVRMFAEAIVPEANGEQKHFQDRARSFIATFLLHLMSSAPKEDRHLETLWKWLRSDAAEWNMLLASMILNDDPIVGEIVKRGANEIISMQTNSDREFGSVMSNVFEATNFIQSPTLRESLKGKDGFNATDLTNGNVTVYLCIPFDKLKSHNAWTKLVIISMLRAVIRKPNKDVCFLIDEANAFGYHSEIETAMGGYAGFGVHIWSIFQDLSQIQGTYGNKWQTFIQNSSVRHFFNISDNFSAEYLEKMFGTTSIPTYNDKGEISGATARPLVTMDEVRRESGDIIYTVIDQLPVAQVPKYPYYKANLDADPNPYYKPEPPKEDEDLSWQRNIRGKEFEYQPSA